MAGKGVAQFYAQYGTRGGRRKYPYARLRRRRKVRKG